MMPIMDYLEEKKFPEDPTEAKKVKYRSSRYLMIHGKLYRRGFSLPYFLCVLREQVDYLLKEIHERVYGNYSGAKALALKSLRHGYCWHIMVHDANEFIKKCDKC